ncbi:MAG TPA: beta-ketoacyl-[acyl-carrier-protein] synthase family protein [Thermoanaerobaculia bacterium]|nr:beta-ketoacyl-[acyl-carrier-protein] synthase family protein [Thermoanaerobaculia bacterium]
MPTTSDSRRVVVTGVGAVCGFGWGVEPLETGLRAGATALLPFSRFDHSRHRTHLAAQVPEPPSGVAASFPAWRRLTQADRFALFAAAEAVSQAGLAAPLGPAAGVFFGSSTGGMFETELFYRELARKGGRPRLSALASQPVSGPGDAVGRHLQVAGPVRTISSACSSATLALGAALDAIRAGEVEVAIAGGSDSLCQLTYAGFNSLRAVAEGPCRPFREGRDGMSIGEGAAVFVLEPLALALQRGALPLAELAGAGSCCDAHHMTAPDPAGEGAAAAVEAALADAGVAAGRVDFVNAHGTGTPLNDAAEWRALERVFGPRGRLLPLTATKGAVGHLLGSAGAIEALATLLCLRAGEVHPTPGDGPVDPALPLALVTGRPLPLRAEVAVSVNLAFGGSNAALVLSRFPAPADRAA